MSSKAAASQSMRELFFFDISKIKPKCSWISWLLLLIAYKMPFFGWQWHTNILLTKLLYKPLNHFQFWNIRPSEGTKSDLSSLCDDLEICRDTNIKTVSKREYFTIVHYPWAEANLSQNNCILMCTICFMNQSCTASLKPPSSQSDLLTHCFVPQFLPDLHGRAFWHPRHAYFPLRFWSRKEWGNLCHFLICVYLFYF